MNQATPEKRPSPSRSAHRRQPRTVRHQGRPSCTTERDLWLLEALGKMRFLTTGQIARLGFEGSRWAANKRLRKLLDAGMVRVWVRHLAEENVYSLDRVGARHLGGRGDDQEAPSTPRGLDGNLDHLLAINDFRISLALGLEQAGGEIGWWRSDWELRAGFRERVVPDALFSVRWGGEERAYGLELDNNSRSARQFLKKVLGYGSLVARGGGAYGISDLLVLVVARDPGWLERYRQSIGTLPIGYQPWFTTLEEAREKGAMEAIWRRANDDAAHSLRELGSLPCGKEGSRAPSADVQGG